MGVIDILIVVSRGQVPDFRSKRVFYRMNVTRLSITHCEKFAGHMWLLGSLFRPAGRERAGGVSGGKKQIKININESELTLSCQPIKYKFCF